MVLVYVKYVKIPGIQVSCNGITVNGVSGHLDTCNVKDIEITDRTHLLYVELILLVL